MLKLLQSFELPEGSPWWLTAIGFILGAIGLFWNRIKSTYELGIKGRQQIEIKKIEANEKEMLALKGRIQDLEKEKSHVEEELSRVKQLNTALSTAMMFMIDDYESRYPDSKEVIHKVRELIEKSIQQNTDKK